jgi:hypothetical protein
MCSSKSELVDIAALLSARCFKRSRAALFLVVEVASMRLLSPEPIGAAYYDRPIVRRKTIE